MSQFHEGQEVEIDTDWSTRIDQKHRYWRKAKIVGSEWTNGKSRHMWIIDIDGQCLLFDAAHIRPVVRLPRDPMVEGPCVIHE